MKIVIFNHVHPDKPHVSAIRMREFSRELAAHGDQVVLLTGTRTDMDAGDSVSEIERKLETHNWSRPMHIAARPVETPIRRAAREGSLPAPFRQAVIGGTYLLCGGMFADWRAGAARYQEILAAAFRPDLVYGTFGNTDTWIAARELANRTRCPWVADYKDPWSIFIPVGFRRLVARRFSSMAALTTFSDSHSAEAERWFSAKKHVVYSGFPQTTDPPSNVGGSEMFHINLTGSVYCADAVHALIAGVNLFSDGRQTKLTYAGNDTDLVRRCAEKLKGSVVFEALGYLSGSALRGVQQRANVNTYIRRVENLFQQKTIELLAAGRPLIVIPDESPEAKRIAGLVGGTLFEAANPEEIHQALRGLGDRADSSSESARMQQFSWKNQAAVLREQFANVLEASE